MLFGTGDVEKLAAGAPSADRLAREPFTLERVEVLQLLCEIDSRGAHDALPPALHPTVPPILTWVVFRCPSSPAGAFSIAQTRIGCRSGVRPRAFLLSSVIDNPDAGAWLASQWGYRWQRGEVQLRRGYDEIAATVSRDGATILDIAILDPDPLSPGDVQYTANMNLARTPVGLRLVQVDPDFRVHRAERGRPRLRAFDGAAWENAGVRPAHPVSGSIAIADLTLPRVRFLCKPDVWAFDGTEEIGKQGTGPYTA